MASCQEIVVEVQGESTSIDPIIAGVGGAIAAVVGIVIGILVTKCFLLDIIKNRFAVREIKRAKQSRLDDLAQEPNKSPHHQEYHRNKEFDDTDHVEHQHSVANYHQNLSVAGEENREIEDSDEEPDISDSIIDCNGICLTDVLCLTSTQLMVEKLSHQKTIEFLNLEIKSWQHRHTCILQVFRLIASQFHDGKQLSKKDSASILRKAGKSLEDSFSSYKTQLANHFEVRENAEGNKVLKPKDVDAEKILKSLVENYRETCKSFEDGMCECIGVTNASSIHDVLAKTIAKIEENIEQQQKSDIQTISETFHRSLIVSQAYHSGNLTMLELMKKRRHYYEVMLRRLSESDRLNDEESSALWVTIRDEIEAKFDQVTSGIREVMEKLQLKYNDLWKEVLKNLHLTKNKSLKRLLSDKKSTSALQFVNNYFLLSSEIRQREMAALQDLNKMETAELSDLQKKAKLSVEVEYEEVQEKLCETLASRGAFNIDEARLIMGELLNKIKKASEDVSLINQIQTKIIEREVAMNRTYQPLMVETSDFGMDDALRLQVVKHKLTDVSKFLSSQVYLSDKDQDAILLEYKVFALLLSNHQDLVRMQTYHRLDAELLRRQMKILELERQEDRLKTDEDVEQVVQKLADLRTDHENDFSDAYLQARVHPIDTTDIEFEIACELAAGAIISILLPELKAVNKLKRQMKGIKNEIQSNVRPEAIIDSDALLSLADEHRMAAQTIEAHLRQEHDIHVQVVKERLNAKHQVKMKQHHERESMIMQNRNRPQSPSTADVLERLLEQTRNKRIIEQAENNSDVIVMTQVYLQRLLFRDKLQLKLHDLDKTMLCKLAVICKIKKNEFIECVRTGMTQASATEAEKKRAVNDFSQRLAKLRGPATRPVNQRVKRMQLVDDDGDEQRSYVTNSKPRPKSSRGRRRNFLNRMATNTMESPA